MTLPATVLKICGIPAGFAILLPGTAVAAAGMPPSGQEAVSTILAFVQGLSLPVKAAGITLFSGMALFAYLLLRNSSANNLRRARRLHEKAIKHHQTGNEEQAREYYRRAEDYRQKALDKEDAQ